MKAIVLAVALALMPQILWADDVDCLKEGHVMWINAFINPDGHFSQLPKYNGRFDLGMPPAIHFGSELAYQDPSVAPTCELISLNGLYLHWDGTLRIRTDDIPEFAKPIEITEDPERSFQGIRWVKMKFKIVPPFTLISANLKKKIKVDFNLDMITLFPDHMPIPSFSNNVRPELRLRNSSVRKEYRFIENRPVKIKRF